MSRLYLRWGLLISAVGVIVYLAAGYYTRHLVHVTPEAVVNGQLTGDLVRVQGMVEAGTLAGDVESGRVRFRLGGEEEAIPVRYDGPPPENLRELKTLVAVGRWEAAGRVFLAHDLALVSNYGFVMGAYAIGLIPLGLFLFAMERRVGLLYREIKQSKLYEPEAEQDVDSR